MDRADLPANSSMALQEDSDNRRGGKADFLADQARVAAVRVVAVSNSHLQLRFFPNSTGPGFFPPGPVLCCKPSAGGQ